MSEIPKKPIDWRKAVFTYEDNPNVGRFYYFAPLTRAAGPYRKQIHVKAIIDIASDGTLAGIELIDNMPPLDAALSTPSASERK